MAAINITRGLDALTSAFNQQSIEFTITTGVIPTVTITSLPFTATKTSTNVGGLDTYVFDLTGILPYILGFPPENYEDVASYRKELTISASGSGATTQTTTGYLCFAVDLIGETGALVEDIATQGRRLNAYTNGLLGFYFSGTTGNYMANIGSYSATVALTNGYNILSLIGDLANKSGLFSITDTDIEFNITQKPQIYSSTTNDLIKWIDADGNFNEWDFRLIETETKIKTSNEVDNYKQTMTDIKTRTREISKEKTRMFKFETVAVDTDHYSQLVAIAQSPCVYWRNMIFKVANNNTVVAECRQNLKFSLTLEINDYVASY